MSKKLTIQCTDRAAKTYEVDQHVANQIGILKNFITATTESGDVESDYKFPLPAFIRSKTFETVIFYCQKLANAKEGKYGTEELFSEIDGNFLRNPHKLVGFLKAVEHLHVQPLEDAACKALAHQIRFKSPLDIRKHFQIVGDLTPEDEARARKWRGI